MYLTELVLQGVRDFVSPRKLAFKTGLNVILGGNDTGKSTITDVLIDLLYHRQAQEALNLFKANQQENGPCRAGISFLHSEQIFRKVVDFSQGVESLSKLNPDNNGYEAITQDTSQIEKFFETEVKLPPPEIYRLLYACHASEFPASQNATNTVQVQSSGNGSNGKDKDAILSELSSLKKLLADSEQIKSIQFKLDGLMKEQFELTDILKKEQRIKEQIAEVKTELDAFGELPEIPEDIDARVEAYEKAKKRHDAEVPALTQDLHELKEGLAFAEPDPIEKDPQFIGGGLALIAAIVTGMVTGGSSTIFNVPRNTFLLILGVVALGGLIAFVMSLFKFLSGKDNFANLQKDFKIKTDKLKAVDRKFEVETTVVRNVMNALSADTTSELFTTISRIKNYQGKLAELEQMLEQEQQNPQYQKAVEALPKIKEEASEYEEKLQVLSSAPIDEKQISLQIANLEAQARDAGADLTDPSIAAGGPDWLRDIPEAFIQRIGRELFYHPTHRLILVACHALNVRVEDFLQKLSPPLGKNLEAFSFKNLSEPNVEMDGTFSVKDAESNARVRFEQLEGFKKDLVYFALKFTLLQFLLKESPTPVIMNAAFRHFDERINPVIAKSIKFLSQQTQVLLLTDRETYAQGADTVNKIV